MCYKGLLQNSFLCHYKNMIGQLPWWSWSDTNSTAISNRARTMTASSDIFQHKPEITILSLSFAKLSWAVDYEPNIFSHSVHVKMLSKIYMRMIWRSFKLFCYYETLYQSFDRNIHELLAVVLFLWRITPTLLSILETRVYAVFMRSSEMCDCTLWSLFAHLFYPTCSLENAEPQHGLCVDNYSSFQEYFWTPVMT